MFYISYYEAQNPVVDGNLSYTPPPEQHDFYIPGDSELALLSAKLTLETNRAGSLTLTVPSTHPLADSVRLFIDGFCVEFRNSKVTTGVPIRNPLWYGRPISYNVNVDGNIEFTCEGLLNAFNDVTIKPTKEYSGADTEYYADPGLYFDELMQGVDTHGVNGIRLNGYGTDLSGDQESIMVVREDERTILYELNNYILNNYGGYFRIQLYNRMDTNDLVFSFWHELSPFDVTDDSDYDMDISKNISDFTFSQSSLDFVTDVQYEWYKENGDLGGSDTFSLIDNTGSSVSDIYKGLYVHRRLKVNNCKNKSEAFNLVKKYCTSSIESSTDISIDAIDPVFTHESYLRDLPWYKVGQLVRVKFFKDSGVGLKYLINKIDYDLLNPFVASYSLGVPLPTLSTLATQNKISEKIQDETQIF